MNGIEAAPRKKTAMAAQTGLSAIRASRSIVSATPIGTTIDAAFCLRNAWIAASIVDSVAGPSSTVSSCSHDRRGK
jgi:hypothetical protein